MNPDLRALCLSEEISSDIRLALSSAELIFEDEEILKALDQLAIRLRVGFYERHPIVLFNLKDAVWFFANVAPRLLLPQTSGYCEFDVGQIDTEITWEMEPTVDVRNRDVLFFLGELKNRDLVTGLNRWARVRGALSVGVVALVDQSDESSQSPNIYSCFRSGRETMFGCGLQIHGYGFSLSNIYAVSGL